MAAWDALAKAAGVPLCVLLGGSVGPVKSYNSKEPIYSGGSTRVAAVAHERRSPYMTRMPDPKSDDANATGDSSAASAAPSEAESVQYSNRSIHEVVQQQIAELLADADISEEDRQRILIAMSCPCCGAGGLSFSIELKPKPGPARF